MVDTASHETLDPRIALEWFACLMHSTLMYVYATTRLGDDLPMDLIINEILTRLPGKYILSMKRVCKEWRRVVTTPPFIHRHHLRLLSDGLGTGNSRVLLLGSYSIFLLDFSQVTPNHKLSLQLFDHFPGRYNRFINDHVVGSCNGLICLFGTQNHQFSLCNPCTRTVKRLPQLGRLGRPGNGRLTYRYSYQCGFAYDSDSYDYHVYVIFRDDPVKGFYVYSLKANSWENILIRDVDIINNEIHEFDTTVVDNSMHWMSSGDTSTSVTRFNLRTRVCDELLLPQELATEEGFKYLQVLHGQLHLITKTAQIWLFNNNTRCWTRLSLSVPNHTYRVTLVAYSKDGRNLLVALDWYGVHSRTKFVVCDLHSQTFSHVPSLENLIDKFCIARDWVESLVPLAGD